MWVCVCARAWVCVCVCVYTYTVDYEPISPHPHVPHPQVDSQWEDCSFRIDTLNIILFTAEGLQEGVTSVQKMIEVDAYDVDAVKSQIGEVLDMLSENLDQMLPPVPEQGFTRYVRIYCTCNLQGSRCC